MLTPEELADSAHRLGESNAYPGNGYDGQSVRVDLAKHALAGLLANRFRREAMEGNVTMPLLVREAVEAADLLLLELAKAR